MPERRLRSAQFAARLPNASITGKKRRFGRETNMAQPQTGRITCSKCNASYDSERELHDHIKTAHRQGGSEAGSPQRDDTQQDVQLPIGGAPGK
jgi:hypothetical protein